MSKSKDEIITFKVDHSLSEALSGIENRSQFIRNAVLAALDSTCPLCRGTGVLSPKQKEHWDEFTCNHHMEKCAECDELHLRCEAKA